MILPSKNYTIHSKKNDIVTVKGIVNIYKGKLEIHVNDNKGKIIKAENGAYDKEDFVPITDKDPNELIALFKAEIESIKD